MVAAAQIHHVVDGAPPTRRGRPHRGNYLSGSNAGRPVTLCTPLAMCNASRHSPGCNCGFGPPYSVPYHVANRTPWHEEALDDQAFAERSLRQEGWDAVAIHEFATQLAATRNSPMPRTTKLEFVRELMGLRQRRVIESDTVMVEVPLFRFGAPPVPGAKMEYIEGDTDGRISGWKVLLQAIGFGDTTTLEVGKSRTFTATNGGSKLVFVPVLVRVSTVAIFDGGREVGRGHEAEVVPPPENEDPRLLKRGMRAVTAKDPPITGPVRESLDLDVRGDQSTDVHKDRRYWSIDVTQEISVSLKPLIDLSALGKVKRVRKLELAFELPAGHHYVAHIGPGFTRWESPTPTPRRGRVRRAA